MKKVRIIAYIIIIYVTAFVIWWMILLGQLEKKQYELQKEVLELKQDISSTKLDELRSSFNKNKSQVIYEGIVFLLLLTGSSLFVIKQLRREQKQNEVNKNFLLATTHELKTPLATTKLNLQTLNKVGSDQKISEKLIQNSVQEVNRLNQLVDNILLASKLDSPNYQFALEQCNVGVLIDKVIAQNGQKDRIKFQNMGEVILKTDSASLQIILQNLIDNALKYSKKHELVEVTLSDKGTHIQIEVKDEGIGIAPEERKKVFKRFYRIEDEATRTTKGTGLGLYLVKEMSNLLNGKIYIKSNQPKGSIFILELPKKA